ncbi:MULTISPECIES: hypothetical protein [unclassified Spirosoma]|uniref:beta strand repeat-containing protein n=1 Tax=unclassified Spirosoma TaxID=2621999 RepID=UPI000966847C|nr:MULTISPECIES: hypothetical protein [unclassified Spirosoma]MBN8823945.1 hypothetical protein [Spirosoma sp.]OJW79422.1 MAG: hypothetical protein BGO59_04315 [Spirosoma sp. 48-14]
MKLLLYRNTHTNSFPHVVALLGCLFLLFQQSVSAQNPSWQSAVSVSNPLSATSAATTIAASTYDNNGHLFVTGSFNYEVTFPTTTGNTTLNGTPDGNSAMFVGKWDLAASKWIWVTSANNVGSVGIAVSGSNVYVSGSFGLTSAIIAGVTLTNAGTSGSDIFLAKYVDNGNSVSNGWAISAGGTSTNETGYAVAASGSSVYLTGRFSGTATIAGSQFTSNGGSDIFLAKYTDNGTSVSSNWATAAGGSANDVVRAITLNGSSIYIGGTFVNSMALNGSTLTSSSTTDVDVFVAKFTDNGSSVSGVWATKGGGSGGNDSLFGLTNNGSDIYFTGGIYQNGTVAGTQLSNGYGSSFNLYLAKVTDAGTSVTNRWATGVASASNQSTGNAVQVSGSTIYVAGLFSGTVTIANSTVTGTGGTNSNDALVARFTDNGNTVSGAGALNGGSSSSDVAVSIHVNGTTVYTSGFARTGATFGAYTLSSTGTSVISFIASANFPASGPSATGFAAVDNTVCVGSPITFTATIGNTSGAYSYTVTNGSSTTTGSSSSASFSQSMLASGSGNQNFTLTISNNSQTASGSTAVTINALPTANILAPASTTLTCTTTSISLTATGGGTYRWDNASTNAIRSVTGPGTYTVTVTSVDGCTAVDTQIINSNTTAPTANILTPASTTLTCTTTSLSLTATGGGTYRWTNNSTGNTLAVNTANTYSVTVTGANGCTAVDSQVIDANTTAPTANILTPASTTLTCTTTSLSLTATGGGTYRWTNNSTGNTLAVNTANTYSVTVTGANGCTATTSTIVFSNTALSVSAGANLSMANVGVVVSLTASGGSSYQWIAPATASFTTPASSSAVSASLTTTGIQTFTVIATSGACSQAALVSVTALSGPDLSPIINLLDANFSAGDSKNFLVQLQEVNGATSTGNIIITITVPVGYTVTFNSSLTSMIISGGGTNAVTVQNNKWTVSNNRDNQQLSLSINSGESVGASSTQNLGFTVTRTTANSGSVSNITVNVADDSGNQYDVNRLNNVFARILNGI